MINVHFTFFEGKDHVNSHTAYNKNPRRSFNRKKAQLGFYTNKSSRRKSGNTQRQSEQNNYIPHRWHGYQNYYTKFSF